MATLDKVEAIEMTPTKPISDGDPTVITTTLYDLVAAIQSIMGPEDDQVVPTVTQILSMGRATFQHPETYQLSA